MVLVQFVHITGQFPYQYRTGIRLDVGQFKSNIRSEKERKKFRLICPSASQIYNLNEKL
jgi:hypothetical protein